MKSPHSYQEVLIFTTTTLSQRTLYRKNSSKKASSAIEELEEAFWDGLLNELIPEIMPTIQQPKMVIWRIQAGNFYLLIDLAYNPETIESTTEAIFSINPQLLSSLVNIN